jgi:ankyrin repeat protein
MNVLVHILRTTGRLRSGFSHEGFAMRAIPMLLPGLLLATCGISSAGAAGQNPGRAISAEDLDRVRLEIQDRIGRGADPVPDAAEAARRGDFRLITLGRFMAKPAGVTCFTPYEQAPEALTHLRHGDAMDERISAWYLYASAYNRALVDRPDYPHADLCRVAADSDGRRPHTYFPVTTAARPISTPPATLHEAARRGSAGDVRRLLASANVDAMDGLDMTPLAWAVVRDNAQAVDLLLRAGASPWVSGERGQDAIFWAAQLGRRSYFRRMERLPGRPFSEWPPGHLSAAASGGDAAIIAHMLRQPHTAFRLDFLGSPLPSAAALAPILQDDPQLATALLWETTDFPADRADLVALALRHGADPNSIGSGGRYGTLLGAFANGISSASVEIVDILLRARADPNLISHRERPVWIAFVSMKLTLNRESPRVHARAAAIFQRLLDAGADLNLPDDQGVPPARLLLFPYRGAHDRLDASFVTPALLAMLVQKGLDLNSIWQGSRILPLVEAQAGVDSELAIALRLLGARH